MPFNDLTQRERDIARGAYSGLSARIIAESLHISHRTVETHFAAIYRKLGVNTRSQLIAVLHDLVPSPEDGPNRELPLPPIMIPPDYFVGRVAEQSIISDAVAAAQARSFAVVAIGGEPGVGKSSLISSAAAKAHADGVMVLGSRCDRDHRAPLAPFVDVMQAYLAGRSDLARPLDPHTSALAALMPGLVASDSRPGALDAPTSRRQLVDAIRSLLNAAANDRPVLLVLEDTQWADHATLSMIRHLVTVAPIPSLALVLTFRDSEGQTDDLTALLADLWREPSMHRVDLAGLSSDETAALAQRVAGSGLSTAESARLHARASGNPFFVVQLARAHRAGVGGNELPRGVREVVLDRIRTLGAPARRSLESAAVLGTEFDADVLIAMERASRAEVDQGVQRVLDLASDARLLVPLDMGRQYRFAHDLAREALLGEIPAIRLAHLHGAAGRALVEFHAPSLEGIAVELAHHFAAAAARGDGPLAGFHAHAAARQAMARFSPEDALEFAALGLRSLPASEVHDDLRLDLLLVEIEAHDTRMDLPAHHDATLRAVAVARRLGDPIALARVVERDTSVLAMGSLDEELLAIKSEVIAALDGEPSELRARLLASTSYQLTIAGRGPDAIQHARRALEDGHALADPDSIVAGLFGLVSASAGQPDLQAQLRVAEDLVALGDGRVDLLPERDGHRFRGLLRLGLGNREGFQEDLDALAEFGDRVTAAFIQSLVASWRAMLAIVDGRLDEAEDLANAVLAISGDEPNFLLGWFAQMAEIRQLQGRAGEIAPLADASLAEHPGLVPLIALTARLHAAAGDLERCRELVEPIARDWGVIGFDWLRPATLAYLAEPVRATLTGPACSELSDLLLPYSGQLIVAGAGSVVLGAADHFRGILLGAGNRQQRLSAPDVLEEAVACEERVAGLAPSTRSRLELARALLQRHAPDDAPEASRLYERVRVDAAHLGLDGVVTPLAPRPPTT